MTALRLALQLLPGRFSVCRLEPTDAVPDWAMRGSLWAVTRTRDELSIVCDATEVPAGVRAETGWSALRIAGTIDFGLTGILAAVVEPLADARIGVFAFSTFDTDYILVRAAQRAAAVAALRSAGHAVEPIAQIGRV